MSEQLKMFHRFLKLDNPKLYYRYDYSGITSAFNWTATKEGYVFAELENRK